MEEDNGVVYHCIKCGNTWGTGVDVSSYGVCPECFASWCREKQAYKGLRVCFGEYKQWDDTDCDSCSKRKQCKEYYELKHDLSGGFKEPPKDIG